MSNSYQRIYRQFKTDFELKYINRQNVAVVFFRNDFLDWTRLNLESKDARDSVVMRCHHATIS